MIAIDSTLKLSDERVRDILAAISGVSTVYDAETGVVRRIEPPTLDELASIANELISKRFALQILEQAETQS